MADLKTTEQLRKGFEDLQKGAGELKQDVRAKSNAAIAAFQAQFELIVGKITSTAKDVSAARLPFTVKINRFDNIENGANLRAETIEDLLANLGASPRKAQKIKTISELIGAALTSLENQIAFTNATEVLAGRVQPANTLTPVKGGDTTTPIPKPGAPTEHPDTATLRALKKAYTEWRETPAAKEFIDALTLERDVMQTFPEAPAKVRTR